MKKKNVNSIAASTAASSDTTSLNESQHTHAASVVTSPTQPTGTAPENFGWGGMTRLSSMERSIRVREIVCVIQIYYIKHMNFHAGGGDASPHPPPGAIPAQGARAPLYW